VARLYMCQRRIGLRQQIKIVSNDLYWTKISTEVI